MRTEREPPTAGSLVLLSTNTCSVRNKWAEVAVLARDHKAEIIAISETWLTEGDLVPQVISDKFIIHRVDRSSQMQGGGAALLVSKAEPHLRLDIGLSTQNIQMCAVSLLSNTNKATIASVYRSPGANLEEDRQLIGSLEELSKSPHKLVIVGDFNFPGINWATESCLQGTPEEDFLEWFHSRALLQHVNEYTRFRTGQAPSLLDLVISRHQRDIEVVRFLPPIGKSDHLVLKVVLNVKQSKAPTSRSRNFDKMDIAQLQSRALDLEWYVATENVTVEDRWQLIRNNLQRLQEEFAPLRNRKQHGKPPWWRAGISRAIRNRDRCWRHYQEVGTQLSWVRYTQLRNKAVSLIRKEKRNFELRLAQKVRQQPKRYYSYAQSKKNLRDKVGALVLDGNQIAIDDQSKATALGNYFKSVHRLDSGSANPSTTNPLPAEINDLVITAGELLKILEGLDKSKAPGPDGIHPAIVRPLAHIIVGPLVELFQASLEEGVLPVDWKTAVVVAIHKGGTETDVKHYRPVSLTSILCKCMEKLIRTHVCIHLQQHALLNSAQHGFMKNRSCLTNLLCYLDEVTERIDEGKMVEVCYLDFSKAFDSVSHRLLLHKLRFFGIGGKLHKWLTEFLIDRTFWVRVGEADSAVGQLTSGVPQGSVLGPLLFLLFINDLAEITSSPCFIFADDVKVVGSKGRIELESDVAKIVDWSHKWDLPLNAEKSQLLSKAETPLVAEGEWGLFEVGPVLSTKDLGVTVTADFSWSTQCEVAAHNARRALFKLRSVLSCRESDVFLPYYKAIVRPHLEYCVQAWSPLYKKDASCLEKVQQLATRMIEGQKGKPYEERLSQLKLFSLERRRVRGDLIETFKIKKGFSGVNAGEFFVDAPYRGTRGHEHKLMKQRCRLNTRAHFFSNRVVNRWNSLPEEIVNLPNVPAFKAALDARWNELFPDMEY